MAAQLSAGVGLGHAGLSPQGSPSSPFTPSLTGLALDEGLKDFRLPGCPRNLLLEKATNDHLTRAGSIFSLCNALRAAPAVPDQGEVQALQHCLHNSHIGEANLQPLL